MSEDNTRLPGAPRAAGTAHPVPQLKGRWKRLLTLPVALFCVAPIALLLFVRFGWMVFALAASAGLIGMAIGLYTAKWRIAYWCAAAAVLAVPCLWAAAWTVTLFGIALWVFSAGFALFCVREMTLSPERQTAAGRLLPMLGVYFAVFLLSFLLELPEIRSALGWIAAAFLVTIAYLSYFQAMRDASRKTAFALPLKRQIGNLLLVTMILALALMLSNVQQMRQLVTTVIAAFAYAVMWLLSLLTGEGMMARQEPGGAPGSFTPDTEPPPDPSWLQIWLERILYVLAIAAVIIGVLYGLYKIVRWISARLRTLALSLDAQANYTEARERLTDTAEGTPIRSRIRALFRRRVRWERLDNRQRVRAAFEQVLRRRLGRGDDVEGKTPSQILSPEFVRDADCRQLLGSYQRARYSQKDVTDEDASNAKKAL